MSVIASPAPQARTAPLASYPVDAAPIPVATMARVDDPTARLLAGTFTTLDRAERTPIPADSAAMVLTVDQWRAKYGRRVAA